MKTEISRTDKSELCKKSLYLFDMDGTIYLGDQLFPYTIPMLEGIRNKGGRYLFLTNNSSKSVSAYVEKLHRLGISFVTEEDFFTSSEATAYLSKKEHPGKLFYVQGTKSFVEGLRKEGLLVTEEVTDQAQGILIGFDSELTMEQLEKTSKMLTFYPDLPYYATNPDWVCPTSWGFVPDCGSMAFGLEKATGRKPIFIGKPEPLMNELALEKTGKKREDAVYFGDRLYTDIKAAKSAGITSVLVLSGECKLEDALVLPEEERPDYCLKNIGEFPL